jgi:hypothetical protein
VKIHVFQVKNFYFYKNCYISQQVRSAGILSKLHTHQGMGEFSLSFKVLGDFYGVYVPIKQDWSENLKWRLGTGSTVVK